MAEPTEGELLRQALQLRLECADYLAETETAQRERWEVLRRVIEDAGEQFTQMRIDAVEARLTDEGGVAWWSVILTLALTIIPFHFATARLFGVLTNRFRKMINLQARKQLRSVKEVLAWPDLEDPRTWGDALEVKKRLTAQIKQTEKKLTKFIRVWEPEGAHTLAVLSHQLLDIPIHEHYEAQHREAQARAISRGTDAPVVVVRKDLHKQLDILVGVEDSLRSQHRLYIRDLFDIATAKDPRKEATAKELKAAKKEAAREPKVPLRRPVERLPKTSKDALAELSFFRDELKPLPIEKRSIPTDDGLRDLQLMVEQIMWASTYDFKPVPKENRSKLDPPLDRAPLPSALWKRLIERYMDPDAKQTYKEVGEIRRLGTVGSPGPSLQGAMTGWSPETRLSHYLSKIFLPALRRENNEVVETFGKLGRI